MVFIAVDDVDRWQNFLAQVGAVMDYLPAHERGILNYSFKYLLLMPREDRPNKRTGWFDYQSRESYLCEKESFFESPERFAQLLYTAALKVADERSARWPKQFAKEWTSLIGSEVPVRSEDGKIMGFDHLRDWIKPKESQPAPAPEAESSS